MPSKKPNKKKSKTWEEIEKEKELENISEGNWVWDKEDDGEMKQYLRRFCCHMVWTGLDAISNGLSQESREEILNEIMETKRWQLSDEEMYLYIPDIMLDEEVEKYAPLQEGVREMNEVQFMMLCNRLAEVAVYNMMAELEKKGYLTLAWDATKNDFVYKQGPKSPEIEGEDWKK
jgi:hypothetical protein